MENKWERKFPNQVYALLIQGTSKDEDEWYWVIDCGKWSYPQRWSSEEGDFVGANDKKSFDTFEYAEEAIKCWSDNFVACYEKRSKEFDHRQIIGVTKTGTIGVIPNPDYVALETSE